MASQAAQSKFCRPEEDPFLLLDRASRSIEQLLRRDLPLRRTWSEQPYGEEEITLLEEEVLPAIAQCLARIDAIDSALSAAGEELYHQEVLAAAQKRRVLLPGEVAPGLPKSVNQDSEAASLTPPSASIPLMS